MSLMYVPMYCMYIKHVCAVVDEWTMEDKVIFEQAYQKYGKNFQRIKSMVSYYNVCRAHLTSSIADEVLHVWPQHPVIFDGGVVKVFSPKPGEMWGWYGVQLVEKVLEQGLGIP